MNKTQEVLDKIYEFSSNILELGSEIIDERIETFEKNQNISLPEDFKFTIKKHNSLSLSGTEIYGIGEKFKSNSLDKIYHFEHFEVEFPMPLHFIPFSHDGRGNHYCLDISKLNENSCPVVFWQHDYIYSSLNEVEICNSSFTDWLKEVFYQWNLDIYNFDGSENNTTSLFLNP